MLNTADLRGLSRQELDDKIIALKKSLFEMVSKKETGRIEKPSSIKETRRDIARIKTILSEMKPAASRLATRKTKGSPRWTPRGEQGKDK